MEAIAMEATNGGGEVFESKETCGAQAYLKKQLHKTKFCMYHLQGSCRFGETCSFAHTYEEMQNTPNLRKTKLCRSFLEGRCTDEMCEFAHGQEDRRISEIYFKRKMCAWNQKGKCRHGSECHFAHNANELRSDGIIDPKLGNDVHNRVLKDRSNKKKGRSEASTTSGTTSPVRSDGSGGSSVENFHPNSMVDLQQHVAGLSRQCRRDTDAWNGLVHDALNDLDGVSSLPSIRVTDFGVRTRDRSNATITGGATSPIRRGGSTRTSFQPNMADLRIDVSNLSGHWQGCPPQDHAPWNFSDLAQAVGDVDVIGRSPSIRFTDYDAQNKFSPNESTASGATSPKSSGSDGGGEPTAEAFRLSIAELTQHVVGVPLQQWQGPAPQDGIAWNCSNIPHAVGNNDVTNHSIQTVDYEACRNEYFEWLQEDD